LTEKKETMTFLNHLEELRNRLIKSIVAIIAGIIICWFFREWIREFLEAPLYEAWASVDGLPEPQPLSFTSLIEPFIAYLKMSAIGGLFLASPVILYQGWKFIAPGLYAREKKFVLPFVFASTLLFVGGSMMAYKLVFPIGFAFFLDFAAGGTVEKIPLEVDIKTTVSATDNATKKTITQNDTTASPKNLDAGLQTDIKSDAGVLDGGIIEHQKVIAEEPVRGPPQTNASTISKKSEISVAPDKEKAWWEHLFISLFRKNCGKLSLEMNNESTSLLFKWNTRRCGETPSLAALTKNGKALAGEWIKEAKRKDGTAFYKFKDKLLKAGHYKYELKTVTAQRGAGKLAPMLMVKDYLSIAIRLLLAFGIVFELPILILFLALAGIVDYRQLLAFSRWFIVLSVVISAMLTPPDVITQILLALPLTLLYFASVLVAYIFGKKREHSNK